MSPRLAPLRRLLATTALVAAALVPLLSAQLPRSADGLPHVFRIALLAHHLRQGELWPRYSPELVYGYGYPLFNYYAPLTYYLGAGLSLVGLSAIVALHGVLALAMIGGAWGAFTLADEWFGSALAGAIAAVGYAFAPYTLFNVYARGAAPEALGVALLPWLLWGLHRALRQPSAWALIRLALLYAALLLVHNLTALTGTALLGVWLIVESVSSNANRQTLHWSLLALLCGLLLGAIFWLPAFAETGAVQIGQLTAPATLDFRNYFLAPAQLLRPFFTFDPHLEPPSIPVAFGWPQLALAVAGVALWRRHSETLNRWRVAALALFLVAFLLLTLNVSQPVWEAVPVLKMIQFPWRFLGPATLIAALLAGATGSAIRPGSFSAERWGGQVAGAVLLLVTAALALPWTFVTRYPASVLPPRPDVQDIFAYEVESGGFGLTSTGEFLPVDVKQLPPADAARAQAAAQGTLDRLDRAALPSTVTVIESASQRLSAEAHFRSPQPFDAVFQWFHFPGWRAEVDGAPVALRASDPHGFIIVPVPAGDHQVRVVFGQTPLRQFAIALSILGALALVVIAGLAARRPRFAPSAIIAPLPVSLILLGLAFLAVRLYLDERDSPFRRSRFDGQTVAGAAQALDVNFGDRLNLIGLDPPVPAPGDQPLAFTLYWRLFNPVSEDYSIAAQLWDEAGHLIGQQDAQHPGGAPTTRWLEGGYAIDEHRLTPYPGTPPGEYRLMVGVYPPGGQTVEVLDASGLPQGRMIEVARVRVLPPTRPATEAELNPAQWVRARLGEVEIIGVDGLDRAITAGDDLPLVLYWRTARAPLPDDQLQVDLASAAGETIALGTLPLINGVVRLPQTLLIPPDAPGGPAEVRLHLLRADGRRAAGPVTLGALDVSVPSHSFAVPLIPSPLEARFGSAIELLGFDVDGEAWRAGQALNVTLYWRAVKRMTTRYTVFVHLRAETGQIAAQSDAIPVRGARPTTGWLPKEVLTDPHMLMPAADLPPGAYALEVGLYDPRTGERLTVLDAAGQPLGDHVTLRSLTLDAP